jgi:hypothetical protein
MRLIRQSAFTFFRRYYKIEKSRKEQYFAKNENGILQKNENGILQKREKG